MEESDYRSSSDGCHALVHPREERARRFCMSGPEDEDATAPLQGYTSFISGPNCSVYTRVRRSDHHRWHEVQCYSRDVGIPAFAGVRLGRVGLARVVFSQKGGRHGTSRASCHYKELKW